MLWARTLAYATGMVNQELLLRNEYLAAENRILKAQIKGRLVLSEGEKARSVNNTLSGHNAPSHFSNSVKVRAAWIWWK